MSALYNEYLTGAEREAAIIVAESDAQFAKLNILFEAVDATLSANMLAAEAKVFVENGTYDDLTMLYTEAEQEAVQKKQGILASIINAIGALFAKIGNFLSSKFGKKHENIPEGDIKIDANLEKEMNVFKKAWNFIKSPFEKIAAGTESGLDESEIKKAWGQIAAEFGAIAAAGTGATLITVNREKIAGWLTEIRENIQKKVEDAIAKLKVALKIGNVANNVAKAANNSDSAETENSDANSNTEKKTFGDKLLAVGKFILTKLQEFGRWIAKWMGKLASAIGLSKDEAKKEADKKFKETRKDAREKDKNDLTRQHQANAEEMTGESVSLFGITLDSDELFTESEMSDEEYTELCDLFAEL